MSRVGIGFPAVRLKHNHSRAEGIDNFLMHTGSLVPSIFRLHVGRAWERGYTQSMKPNVDIMHDRYIKL